MHDYFSKNYPWYNKWHQNPVHIILHWVLFLAVIFSATFFTVSNVNNQLALVRAYDILPSQPIDKNVELSKLTKEILNLSNELRYSSSKQKNSALEKLTLKAEERKKVMVELIKTNPSAILNNNIPAKLKNQMPEKVRGFIEENVTLTGSYTWILSEDFKQNSKDLFYLTETKGDKKKYNLHFTKDSPGIKTGSVIQIKGVMVDSEVVSSADSANLAVINTTNNLIEPLTKRKVAVIMVNFLDDISQPGTVDEVRSITFTDPVRVNGYYKEVSFNKIGLTGAIRDDGDIFGWYTIPYNKSNCDINTFSNAAELAATNDGFVISNYDHVIITWPPTGFCGSGGVGWGTVGGNPGRVWIDWHTNGQSTYSTHIVGHELGHNLGLDHASSITCREGSLTGQIVPISNYCIPSEYGDDFDIMGSIDSNRHFNNYHKGQAIGNYLTPGNTLTLDRNLNPDGVYTITPIEASSTGIQVIRIPRQYTLTPTTGCFNNCGIPVTYNGFYYLEFRQPSGFDNFATTSDVVNGVSIRLASDYNVSRQSNLLTYFGPALNVGQTFADNDYNLSITTNSISPQAAEVRVRFNGPAPCEKYPPTLQILPSINPTVDAEGNPGETISYTYTLTNNDSLSCTPATYSISNTNLPAGWSIVPNAIQDVTLASRQAHSGNLFVTSSITAANFTVYPITFKAVDNSNLNLSNNSIIYYRVFDSIRPSITFISPSNNTTIAGNINVQVEAIDNVAVLGVRFLVDNNQIGLEDTSAPYMVTLDTTTLTDGNHNISANARDATGSSNQQISINVKNNGDSIRPTISSFDIQPRTLNVGATIAVSWNANDTGGSNLDRVEIYKANFVANYCDDTIKDNCSWLSVKTIPAPLNSNLWSASTTTLPSAGTYFYKINVVDREQNRGIEVNPIKITVNSPISITSLQIANIARNSATINWSTNNTSTGSIRYGTSRNRLNLSATDPVLSRTHSITITNLSANSTYYYQITATDGITSTTTPIYQFKTSRR